MKNKDRKSDLNDIQNVYKNISSEDRYGSMKQNSKSLVRINQY
jgi:hypothetical protein